MSTLYDDEKRVLSNGNSNAICEAYNLKSSNYRRRIEKRTSVFDIRTESMRTDGGNPRQGRLFDSKFGKKNGGLRIDEMIYGMKMAHLSCTDDGDDRLENASPNAMIALQKLVGGDQPEVTAKLPLSQILKECFNLNLDCWIDESGLRKLRGVDTQGFIASNDETIVLSYRFTTSLYDWIANLSMVSSEWEPLKDENLGHAGVFSSCRGWVTKYCRPRKVAKPRVHTAYYNYFVYTIPFIRKHILEPLLKDFKSGENVKPKKVYIVGESLGAALSQIAYTFILEELYPHLQNPEYKRVDRLISVTAGCPRVGDRRFRAHLLKKIDALRPLDRAVICRMVYNNDIVPHAPPNIIWFRHIDKLVYITKNGENVIVNPNLSKRFTKFGEIKTIFRTAMAKKKKDIELHKSAVAAEIKANVEIAKKRARESVAFAMIHVPDFVSRESAQQTFDERKASALEELDAVSIDEENMTIFQKFAKEVEGNPEVINDHMPFFYMSFLEKLKKEQEALYPSDKFGSITEAASC